MSVQSRRFVLLNTSALIALLSFAGVAAAEEEGATALPEVVVTTPTPIRRRPPPRPRVAAPAAPAAPAQPATPPPPPPPETPAPGTLPIVTDQFATVTVVPNEEIRRRGGGTLGDLLGDKPGITGSSFAPGGSSRPIIRGLDANRVGIVENGVGSNGASDLGEDHFVPLDPLSTSQIEVIRGPATLRYGSQSIGGIVNGTNNRIPEALPCRTNAPVTGVYKAAPAADERPCVSFETRSAATTVDSGVEGAALLDAGGGNFAVHADAFGRRSSDYRVPRYPYLNVPNPAELPFATQPGAFTGKQPNSSARSDGQSLGGSYIFHDGFVGLAVTQNNNFYHIPGADGEGHLTRIDGHQTKLTSKGEWRGPTTFIEAIRFWAGSTDYKHNEIGLGDATDLASDGIRQTFTNKEQEARVEVQLAPVDLRFAALTTALGVQAGHQELTAPGDDPASPLNGLWDPNNNSRVAGFIFNEFKFSDTTKAQLAGRVEQVRLNGTIPAFIASTFDIIADPASIGPSSRRNPQFTPKSASAGVIQNLPWDLVASGTAQYVERAPKPAELFSRGAHDATVTFDIGNPDLKVEVAKSVEVGLRRATGPFRFEATAYYTRFSGFIFRNLTGNTCDTVSCVGPADPAFPLELRQARYAQRDAIFRGGEFQSQYDVMPLWMGMFGIENQFDVVRATFTDGTNVPRIPPVRVGGGVFWRDDNWLTRINLLHAFAQHHIAVVGETPTQGYNNLKAEISYRWKPNRLTRDSLSEWAVGIAGNNLLNDDIRNHVSYSKDDVLMPGRGVRFFANAKY
ncbi:MAG: iron complex outerrane recepter protein [Alphaproteobacteria bacterium]|nr:iron complex outerrane recepter protein [Alphaproteobacteria bacterium]